MCKSFFSLILVSAFSLSNAQSPIADFTLPNSPCTNEQFEIKNNSLNSNSFYWDFCSGDLLDNNISITQISTPNLSVPVGATMVEFKGLWFGFITNIVNNTITKIEFGTSLNNTPTLSNLGNLGGLLSGPQDIKAIVSNGKLFLFISNRTNQKLIRINMETSANNTNPSVDILLNGDGDINNNGIEVEFDSQNWIVIFTRKFDLTIINLGNNISNIPIPSDIINTSIISNINNIGDISLFYEQGNWYGLAVGYSSKSLHRLNFGASLFSNPSSEIIPSIEIAAEIPQSIVTKREGAEIISFISTHSGNLIRLNFNESITSNPVFENLGTFSNLAFTYKIDIATENSNWVGLTSNWSTNKVLVLNYPNNCSSTNPISINETPFVSYQESANYNITLTANDNQGNSDYNTKTITISSSLAPQPSAQITGNCLSSPINFNGQQISGDITNWNWDFGDGLGTSNLQNDSYSYAATGSYQVKLSVTDANGCNNLVIDTVHVYNEPMPNFTAPSGNLCMNNAIAFTNTSTGETGEVVTWNWNFNGEGASSEKEPTFTFLTPGSKTITLTASIAGCANVTQQTITIQEAPTTSFSFNNTCNSQPNTFTDETTGNNLTSWSWNFGDGNTSTNQSPTHTYATPGEYDVTLTVTNNTGCSTTNQQTIINHSIPVVSFTNDLPCSSSPIQFTDKSLVDNTNIVAWDWDFGDGAKSNIQHPEHLYTTPGDFTVKLKAYSQFGCVDSAQTILTVDQGPEVEFEWDKSCEGEATTFTDLTNSFGTNITDWAWIIEGQLFTTQNPSFTFTNAGTYSIQLSVTVDNLCSQILIQDIIIEAPPFVQFGYDEGCGTNGTQFYDLTNQTDDIIIAREWRVNGSVFSTDSLATTQLDPGNYAITLSIITDAGCEETTTSAILLIGSPIANFSTNTIYGAAPLDLQFTNESTGGSNFLWSFKDIDNTTSTERHPSFTYIDTGTYTVTLRTSSEPDCFEETNQIIKVVGPITKATIIAITPIDNTDKTNFMLTIENNGTTILDANMSILFRADYGTEVIEPFDGLIYAGKTVNYNASFALPINTNPTNICVELIDGKQLDKECILLEEQVLISAPYPNPSNGLISLDVMLENESIIEIRVINQSGQPLITQTLNGTFGLNEIMLEGRGLPQGMYIVEVISGEKTEQFKISIVR